MSLSFLVSLPWSNSIWIPVSSFCAFLKPVIPAWTSSRIAMIRDPMSSMEHSIGDRSVTTLRWTTCRLVQQGNGSGTWPKTTGKEDTAKDKEGTAQFNSAAA